MNATIILLQIVSSQAIVIVVKPSKCVANIKETIFNSY